MSLAASACCLPLCVADTDYERAWTLRDRTRGKVTGVNVVATWSEDGQTLDFTLSPHHAEGPGKWRVDLTTGALRELVAGDEERGVLEWQAPGACRSGSRSDVETEVRFVNRAENTVRLYWVMANGDRRGYGTLEAGKEKRQHTFAGHAWMIADTDDKAIASLVATRRDSIAVITDVLCAHPPKPASKSKEPPRFASPDGQWRIAFKNHNAQLIGKDRTQTPLTEDGTADHAYRPPVHWSPDGRHVVLIRRKRGQERRVQMIDSSPDDRVEPRLVSHRYLKPGDTIARDQPALFRVADRNRVEIASALFSNPWSLRRFHWSPDSREVYFEYNQRGHQVYRVLAVTATNGNVRTVINEQSKTFVDYSNKIDARHLDKTNQVLWMSERDGWNHLYVIDRATGKVVRQLTSGEWVVRGIDCVDEEGGRVWFRLSGMDADRDPYHVHHARIDLDGTGFTRLTQGDGMHDLEFSPDRRFYIDTWSRVNLAPVHELRRADDGSLVCELSRANDEALRKTGWLPPEPFAAKGRDGETVIWGVIYRPTNFEPSNAYPVVEHVYAGPHGQHVPKHFSAYQSPRSLAELGFIVVQIDGMGTNWRNKEFHDVAWKDLKDAGFPDRIAWLKAAAKAYPYLDISRVGIYGGSAGGQNAMRAVLDHHDFYRAAVADCGCHDNRMDKIWWNEAWMGWPVDESYVESSNVTDAHKLDAPLLLMVGELDHNVDPASTMQVVDALIKADKDFELIVFPGKGHGAGDSRYGRRRMYAFFKRHLVE